MKPELMQVTNTRYRLNFHVAAPAGWINDPNGFVYFRGYYHIFYQYHPYSASWGPMHWGHARSKDLVHWETLPIALTPDEPITKQGVFSGSAIVKDDKMYLMYTGHHFGEAEDDSDFVEDQNIAVSDDGVTFEKFADNPVISAAQIPSDNTNEFRDPKVWKEDGQYYVVLGGQSKEDHLGQALLYSSVDLISWIYEGVIAKSEGIAEQGYIWECPDIFTLNEQQILLMSPKGIEPAGDAYQNLHQTGYMIGDLDLSKPIFNHGPFIEIDHGHDFYASQTTLAPDGRRIMFAWMAMWKSVMPEQADGWAGALTFPRELILRDDHVYMKPVAELAQLRITGTEQNHTWIPSEGDETLVSAAQSNELQLSVSADQDFDLKLVADTNGVLTLHYDCDNSKFTVSRSDRLDMRVGYVRPSDKVNLQILLDRSSLEIFINDGETVFTERYYSETYPDVVLHQNSSKRAQANIYDLDLQAIKY